MALKGIFFDHDGTLVDSEVEHYRFWKTVMKQQGIDLPEQQYKDQYCGVPGAQNAQMLVEDYSLTIAATQLAIDKEALTDEFLRQNIFRLLPKVRSTLEYFHELKTTKPDQGLTVGVVSGAIHERVMSSLEGHDLTQYFDFICSGDEVDSNKPDPAVYLLALEKSGFAAHECLAIEDTLIGVESALAAGLDCCVVRTDYTENHDFSLATAVVDDMEQAKQWVVDRYFDPPRINDRQAMLVSRPVPVTFDQTPINVIRLDSAPAPAP